MASTGAAIISAQGDTTGSVWAFRQTQIPGGGGGGGGVTSVVQGSGITVTSSGPGGTGAVTVAATGGGGAVASVTASGVGITASPTTGAVIITNTQPASTWSTNAATQAVAMGANNLNNTSGITFSNGASINITGANLDIYGSGGAGYTSLQSGSGSYIVFYPTPSQKLEISALSMEFKFLTSPRTFYMLGNNLDMGNGGTLTPYVAGGRNYLDINAPAINGVIKGALRLIGNSNSVVLTIAATNDLTNIDTLNGHNLYVYGTFQVADASSTTLTQGTDTRIPFGNTVIADGCSLTVGGGGLFSMTKSGTYRFIVNFSVTTTIAGQSGNFYIPGIATTNRRFYFNLGTQTYSTCMTIPSYVANTPIELRVLIYASAANVTLYSDFAPADINIELVG